MNSSNHDATPNTQRQNHPLPRTGSGGHEYPAATIAPSGRARCLHSGEKIPKDELRIEVERLVQLPFGLRRSTGYILPRNLKEYAAKGGFDGDDAWNRENDERCGYRQ